MFFLLISFSHTQRIEEFKKFFESSMGDLENIFAISQEYKNENLLGETEKIINNFNIKRHETQKKIKIVIDNGKFLF